MSNAEDIKKWLKTIGKNRQWLAEQTLSSKGTVNNWLSSGKPIPSAKLALIERLMNGEDEIQFELPEDFEAIIREKAKAAKKSIDDLVIEILEMTVQKLKKKQQTNGTSQEAVEKPHPALDNNDDEPEEVNNVILCPVKLPEIMVVGNVAAGEITWSEFDEPYPVFDKGITALRVEGTSMEPEIKNGQIVLVRPVPEMMILKNTLGKSSSTKEQMTCPASPLKGLLRTPGASCLLLSTRLSGNAFLSQAKSKLAWLVRLI